MAYFDSGKATLTIPERDSRRRFNTAIGRWVLVVPGRHGGSCSPVSSQAVAPTTGLATLSLCQAQTVRGIVRVRTQPFCASRIFRSAAISAGGVPLRT